MKSMREQLKAGLCEGLSIDIELPPKAAASDKNGAANAISFDISSANIAANDLFSKLKMGVNSAGGKKKDIKRLKISEAR